MIEVIGLNNVEKWDLIVQGFKEYDVYYLSGYVKAFKIHGDGEPMLFYFCGEKTKAINVVMKRDISADRHFRTMVNQDTFYDLVTPYGYGGWLVENRLEGGDAIPERELFEDYLRWCKENNIISEFVRFHPVLDNYKFSANFYDVIPLGNTISMDLISPEIIWNNLSSKNRNMIRKAKKSDIKIFNGRYPEIYRKFREIYNMTMDKDRAKEYYYFSEEFYDSILFDLPQNAQVFYAVLEDKVIATSIILVANGRLNYHLSGSIKEYQSLAPTNLLLYEVALWGYTNRCITFHLGGGIGSSEDNLFKFKKAFYRGEKRKFHIGRKIFCKEIYDKLVSYRKEETDFDEKSAFFPLYRS